MGVQIVGGKALQATFKGLDVAMRNDIAVDVVKAEADELAEVMEEKAPRGRTGELEENIQVGDVRQSATGPEIDVGPSEKTFYARYVELGISAERITEAGRSTGVMPATPFMRPAMDDPRVKSAGQAELAKKIAGLGT